METLIIVLLVPVLALTIPLVSLGFDRLIDWIKRPPKTDPPPRSGLKPSDDDTLPLWTWFLPNPCPSPSTANSSPKDRAHILADSCDQRNRLNGGE